jgi:hypothetical protein
VVNGCRIQKEERNFGPNDEYVFFWRRRGRVKIRQIGVSRLHHVFGEMAIINIY